MKLLLVMNDDEPMIAFPTHFERGLRKDREGKQQQFFSLPLPLRLNESTQLIIIIKFLTMVSKEINSNNNKICFPRKTKPHRGRSLDPPHFPYKYH